MSHLFKGTNMKECYKIEKLFGAYLHDDVTPVERAAVEEHIKTCEKCADDLKSRQKVMEKLKPPPLPTDALRKTQADFTSDVYRKIASDSMRQRSRQVFLRRFVLQPTVAVAALATVLVIGVTQFHPESNMEQKPASVAEVDETNQKELRAALHVKEFFKRQGVTHDGESGYVSTNRESAAEPLSSNVNYFVRDALLPNSQRKLEEANFINYSLGERGRALAEYQQLVDYYPDTAAAVEARERIKTILGVKSSGQTENVGAKRISDMGI